MIIRFWGNRGSIPSPSKQTVEFGANTSCVEVTAEGGETLILDAGTGIRPMGLDYMGRNGVPADIHILISHVHWDHIQGFPFFVPAYIGKYTLHLHSAYDLKAILGAQMTAPFFPVGLDVMQSKKIFHKFDNGDSFNIGGALIKTALLSHPQPVSGFRIEEGGRALVYATDFEPKDDKDVNSIIEFAKGTDAMLIDAQYTPAEYDGFAGRGHTTYIAAAEIAKKAGVKKLILYHHDPAHTDDEIREIEKLAKELMPGAIAAREGLVLEV